MAPPLTEHPAVDRATARSWCIEQSRPVVGLGTLLVDALETAGERQVALVTPPTTRITYPLEVALAGGPHRWVVRGAPFVDGLTGAPVRWDGEMFVDDGPAPGLPVPDPGGALHIDVTAVWPADELTEIGHLAESACEVVLDGPPAGWGVAEPATQRWTRREPTRICRERAPRPTTLVVAAGPRAVGLLTVRVTAAGVHERLRLAVGAVTGPDHTVVDVLAATLAARGARSLTAVWQPGPADATRACGPAAHPVPLGLLVDAEHLPAVIAAAPDVVPVAGGGWVRLDRDAPHADLARVAALLTGRRA